MPMILEKRRQMTERSAKQPLPVELRAEGGRPTSAP